MFSIMMAGMITMGCAPTQQQRINARIVYRNLAPPPMDLYLSKPEKMPEVKLAAPEKGPVEKQKPEDLPKTAEKKRSSPHQLSDANGPAFFVEFDDESATTFDQEALKVFTAKFKTNTPILVVGHAHGASAVGVRTLATQRAETVKHYLTRNGYVNVHTMAAWDSRTVSFAPQRGVYLYIMPSFQKKGMRKTAGADG